MPGGNNKKPRAELHHKSGPVVDRAPEADRRRDHDWYRMIHRMRRHFLRVLAVPRLFVGRELPELLSAANLSHG